MWSCVLSFDCNRLSRLSHSDKKGENVSSRIMSLFGLSLDCVTLGDECVT